VIHCAAFVVPMGSDQNNGTKPCFRPARAVRPLATWPHIVEPDAFARKLAACGYGEVRYNFS
jgi:hypothetical protein